MTAEANGTAAANATAQAKGSVTGTYPMAPLIRVTLISLYLALVLPLPALAPNPWVPWLTGALLAGLVLVVALTSEQVQLDADGIRVGHPAWCAWLLRRGWQLRFEQVAGLTPVGTSQGGRVFYVRQHGGGAFLLPQRIARFEAFVQCFGERASVDTAGVGRLTPPWTYQLLAVLCALMLLGELAWWLLGGGLMAAQ